MTRNSSPGGSLPAGSGGAATGRSSGSTGAGFGAFSEIVIDEQLGTGIRIDAGPHAPGNLLVDPELALSGAVPEQYYQPLPASPVSGAGVEVAGVTGEAPVDIGACTSDAAVCPGLRGRAGGPVARPARRR